MRTAITFTFLVAWVLPATCATTRAGRLHDCCKRGTAHLSAAEMKSHLRHTEPLASPSLGNRINVKSILVFSVLTDHDGNVQCIAAIAGHPLLLPSAIESIKRWKFQPAGAPGNPQPLCGTLVLNVAATERGAETEILEYKP